MWNIEQTKQIEEAQRAAPKETLEQFRTLASAISDITEVGARDGSSSYDMLKSETRALLKL